VFFTLVFDFKIYNNDTRLSTDLIKMEQEMRMKMRMRMRIIIKIMDLTNLTQRTRTRTRNIPLYQIPQKRERLGLHLTVITAILGTL
jgi:hypothetical protein